MDEITEKEQKVLEANGIRYTLLDSVSDDDKKGRAISLSVTGRRTNSDIYYFVGKHNQDLAGTVADAADDFDAKEMINDLSDGCDDLYDTVMDILDAGKHLHIAAAELGGEPDPEDDSQTADQIELKIALCDDFVKQIEHGLETTAEGTITIKVPDWVKLDQMDTAREVFDGVCKGLERIKVELEEQSKDNIDVAGDD